MSDQATLPAPITAQAALARRPGFWNTVVRRTSRDPVTLTCATILLVIVIAAVLAPWIGLADPTKTSIVSRLKPIGSKGFLLGTDELGRDMLSRLVFGARNSLLMGFVPVAVATLIGGGLGVVAGYAGGWINAVVMRSMDALFAFPSVLLAVAISGALGGGMTNGLVALTLIFIAPIARVSESVTMQVRTQDFVDAARITGANSWDILAGHVLSNVIGPILVYASSQISIAIIVASGLSFLGLGVSPPAAEWGLMLSTLRQSVYIAPVNTILPGIMIFVTSICFNLMSDGLRTAMDIKG